MNTYTAGRVTVNTGSMKVFGVDTEWLANNIKQGDIIIINGNANEIQSVASSTELTLYTTYNGEAIEGGRYTIIRMAEQFLAADIALSLQKLIVMYNARETTISSLIQYVKTFRRAGLKVNEYGNISQGESLDPDEDPEISDDEVATDDEIDSLIDDIYDD